MKTTAAMLTVLLVGAASARAEKPLVFTNDVGETFEIVRKTITKGEVFDTAWLQRQLDAARNLCAKDVPSASRGLICHESEIPIYE